MCSFCMVIIPPSTRKNIIQMIISLPDNCGEHPGRIWSSHREHQWCRTAAVLPQGMPALRREIDDVGRRVWISRQWTSSSLISRSAAWEIATGHMYGLRILLVKGLNSRSHVIYAYWLVSYWLLVSVHIEFTIMNTINFVDAFREKKKLSKRIVSNSNLDHTATLCRRLKNISQPIDI